MQNVMCTSRLVSVKPGVNSGSRFKSSIRFDLITTAPIMIGLMFYSIQPWFLFLHKGPNNIINYGDYLLSISPQHWLEPTTSRKRGTRANHFATVAAPLRTLVVDFRLLS